MKRVLMVVLLVLSLAATATGVPDVRLTVSTVTVSPATPLVGETVTVTATIQNSGGSASAVDIERVTLRGPDGRLDRVGNLGALSSGDSLTVPLTAEFSEAGTRTLELVVVGYDEDRNSVRITHPIPVAVERAVPQVELDVVDPAVGAETRVQVTLANPAEAPVRNLVVTFDESLGAAVVDRQVVPLLDAGETTTVNLTTVPTVSGGRELRIRLAYTSDSGTEAATTFARTVEVDPFVDDVGVEVRPLRPSEMDGQTDVSDLQGLLTGSGGVTDAGAEESVEPDPTLVEVVVTNFGTVPLDDVVVAPMTANQTLPRQALTGPILPGERETVVLDLREVRQTEAVRVTVAYDAGVRAGATVTTYTYRPYVGDVRITDARLVRGDDGTITLSGNAANVGRAEVTGLVVAVVAAENVSPTYPQRDYFVGTVGGSDFAPFELTAAVGRADAVPVRVTYQVDGVRYNHVYDLPYTPDDGRDRRGGGLQLPALGTVGAGVALLVGVPTLLVLVVRSGRRGRLGRAGRAGRRGRER